MFALAVVVALAVLVLGWLVGQPFYIVHRRRRIRQQPFPVEWQRILWRSVPLLRRLPLELQQQLQQHIQVFVAEKNFVGCNGVVVTDEMRITIAAQACLLILNRPSDYFPALRQILIYPGAFIVHKTETDDAGVVQRARHVLTGESWSQGQVILSWEDVVEGAAVADGYNVVIHEFAHQLDMETGVANGAPWLDDVADYARWSTVLGEAFATLVERPHDNPDALIDDYAATDPAEFFAVISEVFFEQPRRLAAEVPALYGELQKFYRIDPASW